MNTVNAPMMELTPTPPTPLATPLSAVAALASVDPKLPGPWSRERLLDTLTGIYAYGLIGFGMFFPFLLVLWYLLFVTPA